MFTSSRERRLWVWAAIAIAGIYSTLGLARLVAADLRSRGLLDILFVLGTVVIVVAVVALAVGRSRQWLEVGVALGVTAIYLMVFVRMALPEERTHLIEYSAVAALVLAALWERQGGGKIVRAPWLIAFGIAGLAGFIDELIQGAMASRVFDPVDIGFNTLAAAMAITAMVVLRSVRRRRSRRLWR